MEFRNLSDSGPTPASAGDLHLAAEATARLDEVSAPHMPDYPYRFAAQLAERTA